MLIFHRVEEHVGEFLGRRPVGISTIHGCLRVTVYKKRNAATVTEIELAASRWAR
jgi:hypothetical protein